MTNIESMMSANPMVHPVSVVRKKASGSTYPEKEVSPSAASSTAVYPEESQSLTWK